MPWYNPNGQIRQMTPAELKRDKQILDEFMAPFEAEYARLHPSEEEEARIKTDRQAHLILAGWNRTGHGGIDNPEWGI